MLYVIPRIYPKPTTTDIAMELTIPYDPFLSEALVSSDCKHLAQQKDGEEANSEKGASHPFHKLKRIAPHHTTENHIPCGQKRQIQ